MNTAFGTKSKPDLKIVSWWRPEQTAIAPPDNDLNDKIPDLSKGMRSKLLLLLAISRGAELLVLDAPTDGLDPAAVEDVLRELVALSASDGTTIFFSSHQLAEVEQIAGEILIILVIAFLLFGPKQLPEVGRQVGKAVKGFKETAEDLRKSVEPELNMIQQEVKMAEQDFQASMKEAEEQIAESTSLEKKTGGSAGETKQA